MSTVREATFELLRAHGMTTIFGNPGSTELPMLADFPDDFTYVLGLQELAVMGMADGFAQATGRPTHVNLHTAPGVGNAVGGIFNAQANKSPLVITAGQQVRPHITIEANLTNRDAVVGPQPYVKWSHEPPRAQEVPGALARAIHLASLAPRGPVFVSIPMDDWGAEADEDRTVNAIGRAVRGRTGADPEALADLADRLQSAGNPVLIAGPDIDASGGWDAAIALAERQRLPVWASPATGGGRIGFPENHPQFLGVLPPAIGPAVADARRPRSAARRRIVGVPVLPVHPRPAAARGRVARGNHQRPGEKRRARRWGRRSSATWQARWRRWWGSSGESDRRLPEPRPPSPEPPAGDPMSGSEAMAALADAWPADGIAVLESPSSTLALRNRLRLSRPGSYYFGASGGLGFGISAAVGVQLAQRGRPVVCVLGEGSAQYGITALWTAVAYKAPVTFLVLRNDEYGILKWFATLEQVTGAPGLELPALDTAAVARGYGVPSVDANSREELTAALSAAIAADDGPRLVQARVAAGMWFE